MVRLWSTDNVKLGPSAIQYPLPAVDSDNDTRCSLPAWLAGQWEFWIFVASQYV